ncbi:hypothetical protein [uncultured Marinobacter sp.]|uniref:hypothetical protein n=1 Tax=uncultured Marinobacter sp. TaxID=187379 RepID=UPI002636408A|nr:hypothetical protein [uncultured Marinobacter sp.]
MKYLSKVKFALQLICLAWFFPTTTALAQEDFFKQLGDDAVWLPQVEVNFKSSKFTVVQGEKVGDDGCRYPSVLRIDPDNPINEGEKLVRVTRATNFTECIQLVETGIVEGEIKN